MTDLDLSPVFARGASPYGDSAGDAGSACVADAGAMGPSGTDLSIGRANGIRRQLEPTVAA